MTTFTPGPWRDTGIPEKYGGIQIAADGPAAICYVHKANPQYKANARLIEAAPALLAALERKTARNVECHCDRTTHPSGICAQCEARAAIDQARGE